MAEAPGDRAPQAYFDTPERAERLQLVAHVARNTDIIPYVRGPEGAGKSAFAERLATIFRQETALVSLAGAVVADVPAAICEALGIAPDRWPAAAIDAASENGLMVLVDDVDRLDEQALEQLHALRAAGARLIFLGSQEPAALRGDWKLQLIDLPPLSKEQLKEFLEFIGDPRAVFLKDGELARLHRDCRGLPGCVAPGAVGAKPAQGQSSGPASRNLWRGAVFLAATAAVGLVLWQQDRINALFQPPAAPLQLAEQEIVPVDPVPARPSPPEEAVGHPGDADKASRSPQAEPAAVESGSAAAHGDSIAEGTADAVAAEPESSAVTTTEAAAQERPADTEALAQAPPEEEIAAVPDPATLPDEASAEPLEAGVVPAAKPPPSADGVAVQSPPAVETPPKPEATATPGPQGLDWLRARRADAMTLQLVGARDPAAIDAFIAKHALKGDYAVYERDLGGKPWFSLVYGDYPDRAAAIRARSTLPRALRKAWPRTFESIWQQLPPAD
jgi:DamX protein